MYIEIKVLSTKSKTPSKYSKSSPAFDINLFIAQISFRSHENLS